MKNSLSFEILQENVEKLYKLEWFSLVDEKNRIPYTLKICSKLGIKVN